MKFERDVQRAIISSFVGLPHLLWRQNAGKIHVIGDFCPQCRYRFQSRDGRWLELMPPGASDLGVLTPKGRFVQIEVKSASGKQASTQSRWAAAVTKRNGLYILARSPEDVWNALASGDL